MSEEGSIFETPRKAILKKKLSKLSLEKRKLQFKNYNLVKKSKRLKEKCNNLKQLVSELQKKKFFTVDQINELNLKAETVEFINRLTQKSKIKGYRQKYTPAYI